MPKTDQIAIRIDPAMRIALEAVAAKDERSLSNLIKLILREWLENREKA